MKFNRTIALNNARGKAFRESRILQLLSLLLTSFVEDEFYSTKDNQIQRLRNLIDGIEDKKFLAKAAVYARNEFGMRSICHVLVGELLKHIKNEQWLKNAIAKIIVRPDDANELVAYYLSSYNNLPYKKGLPAALRKGIKIALENFDSYQLAKYKSNKKLFKMVDIFNLVHPKPTSKTESAFSQLMTGSLKCTNTWEAKLTKAGQEGETQEQIAALKKEAWKELTKNKKLGYFATLRNLRNIICQSPESLSDALDTLTNSELIKKSKVLPFRFLTAIEELECLNSPESKLAIDAINKALDISLSNVPVFHGRTLVALDVSGSMVGKPLDVGALFAAALLKVNNADLILFSYMARYFDYGSTNDNIGIISSKIKSAADMGGTNFHSIFNTASAAYDRIIILSDMQGWIDNETPTKSLAKYKSKYGCEPYVYSMDLVGYGTLQFPEKDVYCIAGLSEKVFDLILHCEQDKNILISRINSIEI